MRRPANVAAGEWGCKIVYWVPAAQGVPTRSEDEFIDGFVALGLYTVFSIDQVESANLDHLRAGLADTDEPLTANYQPADEAVEAARMGMGIRMRYRGGKAFYSPAEDYIQVPPKATFESLREFYGTVFHEVVHATEQPSRLDWSRGIQDNTYDMGELIAELGGVFVCQELGVPASEDLSNHVAYLASWLRGMKHDNRFIIMASAQASRAASYILSFSRKLEEDGEAATF
jgi:antirestriction protein ArdC